MPKDLQEFSFDINQGLEKIDIIKVKYNQIQNKKSCSNRKDDTTHCQI